MTGDFDRLVGTNHDIERPEKCRSGYTKRHSTLESGLKKEENVNWMRERSEFAAQSQKLEAIGSWPVELPTIFNNLLSSCDG